MKTLYSLLLIVVFLGSCAVSFNDIPDKTAEPHNHRITQGTDYPAGRIREGYSIVKTAADFDTAVFDKLNGTIESSLYVHDGYRYFLVKTSSNADRFRTNIQQYEGVVYAQADYEYSAPMTVPEYHAPLDRFRRALQQQFPFGTQDGNVRKDPYAYLFDWGLVVTGALEAFQHYDVSASQYPVMAAIIDTGTNVLHEDFFDGSQSIIVAARSSLQYGSRAELPSIKTTGMTTNWDNAGHGSHCTGIMAAVGNNDKGICGVSHARTQLIAYRGIDAAGSSEFSTFACLADLAAIITELRKEPHHRDYSKISDFPEQLKHLPQLKQAAVPVNMSLGGGSSHPFEMEVLNRALAAGVLPVVAMGNDGKTAAAFPAAYQGVISVGATNMYDTRALFSNGGTWMSVCAPGEGIYSCGNGGTDWRQAHSDKVRKSYLWQSGTSMATPFVTGAAAYLLSINPNLSSYQIKTILEQTADKIGQDDSEYGNYDMRGHSKWYGYGRINVFKAAQIVANGTGIPAVGSVYSEKAVKISVRTGSWGIRKQTVWVYEKDSGVCVAAGLTNNAGFIEFRGLRTDTEYEIGVNLGGTYSTWFVKPDGMTDTAHDFVL